MQGNETTPHIMVVDDHRDIREPLAKYLEKNGFRVTLADSAASARKALKASAVDLAVLDVMMPGEDGLSLCRYLRETEDMPVILLTAMVEETDRVVGLEIGADDYVTKPFNPRELLARIKAVIRRAEAMPRGQTKPGAQRLTFDRWTFDLSRRELVDEIGVATPLSTGEYKLLKTFVEHPGMVLTRDQLLDMVSGRAAQVFDRSIDNQVSRLRRKIEEDPKNPVLIKTVWGGGYTFTPPIEAAS